MLAADGKLYGPNDPGGLADMVRERGWLDKSPAAADYNKVVNLVLYNGMMRFDSDSQPSLKKTTRSLDLTFVRVDFPSQAKTTMTVSVGTTGPATVTAVAVKP